MHKEVKSEFRAVSEMWEGVINHMYLDIKGLVTIGIGNLIEPINLALALPFEFKKGFNPVTQKDIREEWNLVKSRKDLAYKGAKAAENTTKLILTDEGINLLFSNTLKKFEEELKKIFKEFELFPADAQMALFSMFWALGPVQFGKYKYLITECKKMNFDFAANNCKMNEKGNAGLIKRNIGNKLMFQNAAAVKAGETAGFSDIERLYYPETLLKPMVTKG